MPSANQQPPTTSIYYWRYKQKINTVVALGSTVRFYCRRSGGSIRIQYSMSTKKHNFKTKLLPYVTRNVSAPGFCFRRCKHKNSSNYNRTKQVAICVYVKVKESKRTKSTTKVAKVARHNQTTTCLHKHHIPTVCVNKLL